MNNDVIEEGLEKYANLWREKFMEQNISFNPNNSNEIVQSISKALNVVPDEYVQMCESSRRIAEDMLDEAIFFEKYNNILTE